MSGTIEKLQEPGYTDGSSTIFDNQIDEILTVKEVAKLLKLSEGTVRHMVLTGEIPTVRPRPRAVRFNKKVIGKWLSERSGYS